MAFMLLAYGYFEGSQRNHDELGIRMVVAALGSIILISGNHFVAPFLGP